MSKNSPMSHEKPVVIFVPGGVLPGDLSYGSLLRTLGDQVRPLVKDLEVYASDTPPGTNMTTGFSWDMGEFFDIQGYLSIRH